MSETNPTPVQAAWAAGFSMYRCYWEDGELKSARIPPEEYYITAASPWLKDTPDAG